MVPLRAIFEAMEASVSWDAQTQTVTGTRGNTVVTLTIGSTSPTVNNRTVTIDQPGVIIDGRTLVPLRFVGEAFGATVDWDSSTRLVTIVDGSLTLRFNVPDVSVSILFVGNSFTAAGNVPGQLQAIAGIHGIDIEYLDISAGGATLADTSARAIRAMQDRSFDYIVLQDQSRRPLNNIEAFLADIRVLSDAARRNGVTPVLYNPAWPNVNGQPDEALQNVLTNAYKQAANENNAILVNAGDAWVYAYRTIPGLALYASDMLHANEAGAFLTASVFAATLFDMQIMEIPGANTYRGNDALALAKAAWDFVRSSS